MHLSLKFKVYVVELQLSENSSFFKESYRGKLLLKINVRVYTISWSVLFLSHFDEVADGVH